MIPSAYFDEIIPRQGTGSLKWDLASNQPGQIPVIPLWVADMDFRPPQEVTQALKARIDQGIFGYTHASQAYFSAILKWYRPRGRDYKPEELVLAPSVMHGLSLAVRAFTAPGDRIMVQSPVYYPFFRVVRENGRSLVDNPLKENQGFWTMDLIRMEQQLLTAQKEGNPVKALILCAPHNPVGRVWTREELAALGELVQRYNLLVFSDEIHSDWVWQPHVSPLDLGSPWEDRTLVITGPNKTFNLAGLHICHGIIKNPDLRARFQKAVAADFFDQPNVFSQTAALAAYTHGESWLEGAKAYVQGNFQVLEDFLTAHWPGSRLTGAQGTYLAWVDIREFLNTRGFQDERALVQDLETLGRVKLSAGSIFQTGGTGWIRINLACPRKILEEGLGRVQDFLGSRTIKLPG